VNARPVERSICRAAMLACAGFAFAGTGFMLCYLSLSGREFYHSRDRMTGSETRAALQALNCGRPAASRALLMAKTAMNAMTPISNQRMIRSTVTFLTMLGF
jgi:hypothetical protein